MRRVFSTGGRNAVFFSMALLAVACASAGLPAPQKVRIYGKVLNQHQEPVAHATVVVHSGDLKGDVLGSDSTRRDGTYEVWHGPVTRCAVDATPPAHKGLSQTMLTQVPGREDKHLIISLHPGFEVHGRVVWKGKGLRGVAVKAIDGEEAAGVHTGSLAVTDGKGNFTLFLTPGAKRFEVYPANFAGQQKTSILSKRVPKAGEYYPKIAAGDFVITEDKTLPDIVVPDDAIEIVAK